MNSWLCKKSNYGVNLDVLSNEEKIFYFNVQIEEEVNNGGFAQFFYNGDSCGEIVASLRAVGAYKTAEICNKALVALGESLPKNKAEREMMLDRIITDEVSEVLSECNDGFYNQQDDLSELNYQFVIKNKDEFTRG